jgi:hypothetical protein
MKVLLLGLCSYLRRNNPSSKLVVGFVTPIPTTTMICTLGHSTQEGHLFYEEASSPEDSPRWVRDVLGERPQQAPIEGHKRMGMLMNKL